MLSSWWITGLSCLEMSALCAVLVAIARRTEIAARWPSLFSSILLEFSRDIILITWLSRPGHYKSYFYFYWYTQVVRALLRLWIIGDIVRSFEGIDFLPSKVYLFVGTAGATMALASGYYCFHLPGPSYAHTLSLVFLLNQCVNIGWSTFCIAVLASIKLINLGWTPMGAKVTVAVVLRIIGDLVVGEMFTSHNRSVRLSGNGLDSVITIAICAYMAWLFICATPEDAGEIGEDDLASEFSRRSAYALLAFGQRREG